MENYVYTLVGIAMFVLVLIGWEARRLFNQLTEDVEYWKSRAETAEKKLSQTNRYENVILT
jgi:hypothetical protein